MDLILAGIVLVCCAALLLRMVLPERHRRRVDTAWQQSVFVGKRLAHRVWFWREHRRRAAREAEEAIRRAQRKFERDGSVIRPDAFKGPRKPH
jgi:hypothetical protein